MKCATLWSGWKCPWIWPWRPENLLKLASPTSGHKSIHPSLPASTDCPVLRPFSESSPTCPVSWGPCWACTSRLPLWRTGNAEGPTCWRQEVSPPTPRTGPVEQSRRELISSLRGQAASGLNGLKPLEGKRQKFVSKPSLRRGCLNNKRSSRYRAKTL